MANKRMIATEPMRYRTRMLAAGDAVTMSGPHSRLYELLGKAKPGTSRPQLDHELVGSGYDPDAAGYELQGRAVAPTTDIAALRDAYLTKFGKRPFNGWSADTLREKLAQA